MTLFLNIIYKTEENYQNHTYYRSKKSKKYSIIRQKIAKKYQKSLKKSLIIDQKTGKVLNNKARSDKFDIMGAEPQNRESHSIIG